MTNTAVYKGNIISSASYEELKISKDSYIVVEDAFIEGIYERLPERYEGIEVNDYGNDLIIPAFSDLHMHAPSMPKEASVWTVCFLTGSTITPFRRNPVSGMKTMRQPSTPA